MAAAEAAARPPPPKPVQKAAGADLRPPRRPLAKDGKNGQRRALNDRLTQLVVEEIRRVAKERANGMTLDTSIVETGMDSLERMEILASLEERFGGRFPEEILPELETSRQVVAAVEKYLGTEPRAASGRPADARNPAGRTTASTSSRSTSSCGRISTCCEASGLGNPFSRSTTARPSTDTIIDGRELINFSQLQLPGHVRRSGRQRGRQGGHRSLRHQRFGQPAGVGREGDSRELERAIARFLGTEDTIVFVGGHATNETVIGHLLGPGDLILHDALAHNSIVQGASSPARGGGLSPTTIGRPPIGCWSSSGTNIAAC